MIYGVDNITGDELTGSLSGNTLNDIVDEGVEDGHGLVRDASIQGEDEGVEDGHSLLRDTSIQNLLQHLMYVYKITNYECKELTGSQVTIRSKISSTKGDIVNEGVEGGHSLASIRIGDRRQRPASFDAG